MLGMTRRNLVTKEEVKKAAEGKLKNDINWHLYKGSINDDLERFLINLQNKNEIEVEIVWSFFTPKLTNEELKLIKEGNKEHLNTYWDYYHGWNPDVNVEEMKKSNSKSKYVHANIYRRTIPFDSSFENIRDSSREVTITYILANYRIVKKNDEPTQAESKAAQPSKETLISSRSKVEKE